MDLKRADSKSIRDDDRQKILSKVGITKTKALAVGSEAEVYEYDDGTLLKIYAGSERFAYFESLRNLYSSVDVSASGIKIPQIQHVMQFENIVGVIETRIKGKPLEDSLKDLQGENLKRAENLYFDAVFGLKKIRLKDGLPTRYLLFDDDNKSDASKQRFETFYASFLKNKLNRVGRFFQALDETFNEKATALVTMIYSQPGAPISLIHGDFFPGNVIVNEAVDRLEGVIDFGSFTMFGNYLLDVAGAFSFYKMYYIERREIRKSVLPHVLSRIPGHEKKLFFQFLLANAILTSDLYALEADPRTDGHFQWAAEIVSEQDYWESAL